MHTCTMCVHCNNFLFCSQKFLNSLKPNEDFDDLSTEEPIDDKYNIEGHFIENGSPIFKKANTEKVYPPQCEEVQPLAYSKV